MVNVSAIVVSHNSGDVLQDCLESLSTHVAHHIVEVIVVDNASKDGSVDIIRRRWPNVVIVANQQNHGFARACNQGAAVAQGSLLLFLNPDIRAHDDFLSPMVKYLEDRTNVGVLCPRLTNDDGSVQLSFGRLPTLWRESADKLRYALFARRNPIFTRILSEGYTQTKEVEWVTGACMLVRKTAFERIGGFDEKIFLYFEDKDFCKRVREAGYSVVHFAGSSLTHLLGRGSVAESSSHLRRIYRQSQVYYYAKHHTRLQRCLLRLYLSLIAEYPK